MEKKALEEKRTQLQKEKENEEELQRLEKEEEMATSESRPLVEHEEITSSVSILEIEEIISNQLEVEADPLIVPTIPSVEKTKEETTTPVTSIVSFSISL